MTTLIFDIEANGFLAEATRIHCIWIEDLETGEREGYGPDLSEIHDAVWRLMQADCIVGHNILKYDIPVINKIIIAIRDRYQVPFSLDITSVGTRYIDTLVLARLLWPDVRSKDGMGHRLEDWGKRLKVLKGEYSGSFDAWNETMHAYCEQDVVVTRALYDRMDGYLSSPESRLLEHQFAFIMAQMEANGFGFDEAGAAELYAKLVARRQELAAELKVAFPPEEITTYTPKKKLPRTKLVEFNPSSRDHIARRLQALGWVPQEFTDGGKPKVDETVLESIYNIPEAKLLNEHFLVEKRIGQIAEGKQAWLKVSTNGVIHGAINPNGAVTGRCTHSLPNVSQVPKVGSPYGGACRALFRPTRRHLGWVQVGADLSGIELRCKAHYLAAFDGGAYAQVLLEGDIHWANVVALGLASGERDESRLVHKIVRNAAKTFIYAYLYGAGNYKVATIIYEFAILALESAGSTEEAKVLRQRFFGHDHAPSDADFAKAGKRLKARFLKRMPALQKLADAVSKRVSDRGYLVGLDGRKLRIRSAHSALNTLLQAAGAVIAKQATIEAWELIHSAGFVHGRDWAFMAHVHDEVQIECRPDIAEEIGNIVTDAMTRAGEAMHMRVKIEGEYHVGANWKDCH